MVFCCIFRIFLSLILLFNVFSSIILIPPEYVLTSEATFRFFLLFKINNKILSRAMRSRIERRDSPCLINAGLSQGCDLSDILHAKYQVILNKKKTDYL